MSFAEEAWLLSDRLVQQGGALPWPQRRAVSFAGAAPFVDWPNDDYRLSAPTEAGLELTSPFDVDPLGATRGVDGTWDRGPYEYE